MGVKPMVLSFSCINGVIILVCSSIHNLKREMNRVSNAVAPILDMVRKMLQNNDPHEKILSFLDSSLPNVYSALLRDEILSCKACGLHECNHTPFIGNIYSEIMMVGEAPGEQEEKQGEPFVGPAGELFTRMLTAAAEKINPRWARDNVYITNTIKCRPKDGKSNRQPELREIAACKSILDREISIVKPKVIICVGAVAANTLIHPNFKITEEHGHMFGDKTKLVAIYHPSYVLHRGEDTEEGIKLKNEMWEDLIAINDYLEAIKNEKV